MSIKKLIYCLFFISLTFCLCKSNFSYAEENKIPEEVSKNNNENDKDIKESQDKNNLEQNYIIIPEKDYLKDQEDYDTKDNTNINNGVLKKEYIYLKQKKPFIYSHMPSTDPVGDKLKKITKKQAKAHSWFIGVSVLGFGYNTQEPLNKGNYDKDIWLNRKDYNDISKTFEMILSYSVDYSFLTSQYFNPLIGIFINISFFDFLDETYKKTISTTNENGLKTIFVESSPRIDIGVKLGNVILTDSTHMIIPYIAAGYSCRNEALFGDYKVKPYKKQRCSNGRCSVEVLDHKTSVIDNFANHFVFVGTGIDYNISIFKIGLYAKFLYPINNILLTDNEKNIINFGKRLIFSTGVNIGVSIPVFS